MTHHQSAGFTLIELLLSVVIITMLTGISIPVYESFVRRNDLDLTGQNLAFALRRAATYARGAQYDAAWGVKIQPASIVLFQGATYATRNATFDETTVMPSSVTPAGLSEVQFSKLNALPNTTGSVTLTSTTNDIRTVTINAKGMVSY
jgi:prepilin-type N-terminal cleavage/methylation domain-containing protein